MNRTGFYQGSFDPVTYGHLDIISRAAQLVDRLVIGVGRHHEKSALFSTDERIRLIKAALAETDTAPGVVIDVMAFSGLTVQAAEQAGADMLIRGLRDSADLPDEIRMADINHALNPAFETVFLASRPAVRHIAAKFVRQIAMMGGDISGFVPPPVEQALKQKMT